MYVVSLGCSFEALRVCTDLVITHTELDSAAASATEILFAKRRDTSRG